MKSHNFLIGVLLMSVTVALAWESAAGQGKSAIAQRAGKRDLSRSSKATQSFAAPTVASAVKRPKPLRRHKPGSTNQERLRSLSQKFSEVEIVLSEDLALADISALPRAPGSDLEILDSPRRVRVQLLASEIKTLFEQGAEVTILRNFILVEGSAGEADSSDGDVAALGSCSGPYREGSNGTNVFIPDDALPAWVHSDIWISGAPSGATVMCIDVHYEIIHPWVGELLVDLSDQDLSLEYNLWDDPYAGGSDLSETVTGITAFNSELVNQAWRLWAIDTYPSYDYTYIDYWWIKLYYDDGSGTPEYCDASGGCSEYISNVEVGTINNSSGCDDYHDYTAMSTEMELETGYPITITNGAPYQGEDRCGIWVDWNGDKDFDDVGESIAVTGSPGDGPYTATITPPADANIGQTRMRIRIDWSNTLNSCGTSGYGEVEDYTITILQINNGIIRGSKFNDLDEDGDWDGGEPGIEGWEIYLDMNGNKQLDAGEPNVITDSNGDYEFTGLAPGLYVVDEVHPAGWAQTYPGNEGRYTESIDADEIVTDRNFGNRQISGTLISIQAIEDTYADSGNPDTNYGGANGIVSGKNGSSIYRAFVKFDLSSIPASQVVVGAKLRLENSYISIPAPELDVYRASDKWDESTVTWNDQPGTIVGGLIAVNRSLVSGDETIWDVTTDVDTDYVSDGFYSVRIVISDEDLERRASFWSRDLGWAPMAPTLEVEYEPIFGGGTGEPNDPYQIWTGEQMNSIGLYPNRWDKHYKLMDNISLADYSGGAYNIIGDSDDFFHDGPFGGVFDGNNHSISEFSCSRSNDVYVGIFGYVKDGTIKNLKLVSPSLTDASYDDMRCVGPIAGYVETSDISGCSVVGGTVEGQEYVGGLVGLCQGGFIADCSSSASVSGTSRVGGLVGSRAIFGSPDIKDCYAQGAVTGDNYVGGFIGNSSDAGIVNCYSSGLVTADTNVGGFSGYNVSEWGYSNNIISCFWDSQVNPDVNSTGNIDDPNAAGKTTVEMQTESTFTSAGWDFVGELANGGSDDWAMPAGGGYPVLWYELPVAPNLPIFAGGSGTIGDPYLIGTEAQLNSIGHNPRLMDRHFRLISDLDLNGLKYYMIADRPYVFSGTFDGNEHTISNLLLDIKFGVFPAGFVGSLEGTGASIQNLTLVDPNVVSDWGWGVGSLLGKNEGGTITNCHAVNVNIEGLIEVGGLVGTNYSYGRISGCSATGNVSESGIMNILMSPVGGLAGNNSFWSEIENSYANCDVSGGDFVGGLVGYNVIYATITNCYASGTVTGTLDYVGGFIGRTIGGTEVDYCYSNSLVIAPNEPNIFGGFVGGMGTSSPKYFTACFWDSDINPDVNGIGNETDPNVIGETTANMQTMSTFTSAGWDFLNETTNGTDDIWMICEAVYYPRLAWQSVLVGDLDLDHSWMYQSLPGQSGSTLTATVSIADDPLCNSSYSYEWEFILPNDVNVAPATTAGGGSGEAFWTFAARGCDEPNGISDLGQAFKVKVTVTGNDYGNTGTAEAQFGIALLGDVNNSGSINATDRSIINAFWMLPPGSVAFTLRDCDLNCSGAVNSSDRSIVNGVWRGMLGQNSVTNPCPFR